MRIDGATALVTGAGRGLGRHFVQQLLSRGARVYAAARHPGQIDVAGARPLTLDVTDPDSAAMAARSAPDVDLLVNNAGLFMRTGLLDGSLDGARAEMEVNFWGTLSVIRAFAPVLAANGGGAILNVASVASWTSVPGNGSYAVSKAANWNMSNALRHELSAQRTSVTSLHFGAADTDMLRDLDIPKVDPADVVRAALDGIEDGAVEVLADDAARAARSALCRPGA